MIPQPYITEWSAHAPWPAESQIEQDLILSRLIVETTPEFLDDIRNLTLDLHGYEHRPAAELLMQRLGIRLRNAPADTPALHFPEQA